MTPTQAQIEAADKMAVAFVSMVVDAVDREGELGAYEGIEVARKIKDMILALTAAAEVGKPDPTIWVSTEAMNSERNATIERCAQVADDEEEMPGDMPQELHNLPLEDLLYAVARATKKSIAAAIRALKDKP